MYKVILVIIFIVLCKRDRIIGFTPTSLQRQESTKTGLKHLVLPFLCYSLPLTRELKCSCSLAMALQICILQNFGPHISKFYSGLTVLGDTSREELHRWNGEHTYA